LILGATDVGELVAALLSRRSEGRVTRVFRNSVYIVAGDELVLLLHGDLRSPINANLPSSEDLGDLLSVGELCTMSAEEIAFGGVTVRTNGARVYRSDLGATRPISPVTASALAKGVGMLKLLYGAAPSNFNIFSDEAFRKFADSVLIPLAKGDPEVAHRLPHYLPLIGLGGGFTPAGDDFIGGFAATFNHAARVAGDAEILFSPRELAGRTVPESAALIRYAQRGYVDEELAHLITSTFGGRRGRFFGDLLQVAKRGHTSGIDMSMGVLLATAAIRARTTEEGALDKCLKELWVP
jgi:hypothetical protein